MFSRLVLHISLSNIRKLKVESKACKYSFRAFTKSESNHSLLLKTIFSLKRVVSSVAVHSLQNSGSVNSKLLDHFVHRVTILHSYIRYVSKVMPFFIAPFLFVFTFW